MLLAGSNFPGALGVRSVRDLSFGGQVRIGLLESHPHLGERLLILSVWISDLQ